MPISCLAWAGAAFVGGFASGIFVVWLRASWMLTLFVVNLTATQITNGSTPRDIPVTVAERSAGAFCVGRYVLIEQPGDEP